MYLGGGRGDISKESFWTVSVLSGCGGWGGGKWCTWTHWCVWLCVALADLGGQSWKNGEQQKKRDGKKALWRAAGLKWNRTVCELCLSLVLCFLDVGEEMAKPASAVQPPHYSAPGAECGFKHEGLPLLWQIFPHLPPSEGPSKNTYRWVRSPRNKFWAFRFYIYVVMYLPNKPNHNLSWR